MQSFIGHYGSTLTTGRFQPFFSDFTDCFAFLHVSEYFQRPPLHGKHSFSHRNVNITLNYAKMTLSEMHLFYAMAVTPRRRCLQWLTVCPQPSSEDIFIPSFTFLTSPTFATHLNSMHLPPLTSSLPTTRSPYLYYPFPLHKPSPVTTAVHDTLSTSLQTLSFRNHFLFLLRYQLLSSYVYKHINNTSHNYSPVM